MKKHLKGYASLLPMLEHIIVFLNEEIKKLE
jgi:hypothetical protein